MEKRTLKLKDRKSLLSLNKKEMSQLDFVEKYINNMMDLIERAEEGDITSTIDNCKGAVGEMIYECKNDYMIDDKQTSKFAKFKANKKKEQANQLIISELRKVVDLLNNYQLHPKKEIVAKLNELRWNIKDKKIIDTSDLSNCLRSNTISTSQRNSVLENLFKQSKKTPSKFVEEMREIARKHANANASIARVIEFEKYLKNIDNPQPAPKEYYFRLHIRQYLNVDSNEVIQNDEYLSLSKDIHFEAFGDETAIVYAEGWWEKHSYDLSYAYETDCELFRKSDDRIIYNLVTKEKSQRNLKTKVSA